MRMHGESPCTLKQTIGRVVQFTDTLVYIFRGEKICFNGKLMYECLGGHRKLGELFGLLSYGHEDRI